METFSAADLDLIRISLNAYEEIAAKRRDDLTRVGSDALAGRMQELMFRCNQLARKTIRMSKEAN